MLNTNRFEGLLSRADELVGLVADLHEPLSRRLRNGGDPNAALVFLGCQYCSGATSALEGMRTVLFNRPACPTQGRDGKMENANTLASFVQRVEEMAKVLGLEQEQVMHGLLEAADLQYNNAYYQYQQALSCATAKPCS